DLIWEGGIERMHYSISDTAEYGSHAVGPKVVDAHVRENMRSVLENIRSGAFAKEWIAEMERGQPSLEEYRRKLAERQIEQVGAYVLDFLRRGKHVVSANKQLIARRGAELFATASAAGVQLRFEASVCAAIPVIKVLRESLVVTNVHGVLGIVNGTTNFVLTE